MSYAAESDLEAFVGATVDATRAALMLDLASASIDNALGFSIEVSEADEVTLYGAGSPLLLLPAFPVTAVDSVTLVDDALIVDDDYTWTRSGELRRTAGWPLRSVVVVTYDHGLAAVPAAVKSVCLEVAARGLANPAGLQSFAGDGTTAQFSPALLDLTLTERDRVMRAIG